MIRRDALLGMFAWATHLITPQATSLKGWALAKQKIRFQLSEVESFEFQLGDKSVSYTPAEIFEALKK